MSPNDPQLTVVIATRNRPELLREAMRAVDEQEGVAGIEIIVVHDQSDVDEAVSEVVSRSVVRVVANHHMPGLAGARNTGIDLASGEFLAFCDDDDVWLPGKASAQLALLAARPEAALVTTGIVVEYGGEQHPRLLETDTIVLADLIRDRHTELHPSTFLYRTDALRSLGSVSTAVPGGFGEDYELLLRTARSGPIANVRRPLVRVRWHGSSYFFERWRTMAEGLQYILDEYPEFRGDRRGFARVQGQIAFARAAEGRRDEALSGAMRAARANPLEARATLAVLVAARIVRADWVMKQLHRVGRGI